MKQEETNKLTQGIKWASEVQAIAQNGLTFATGDFDRERYTALRDIAAQMLAYFSEMPKERILDLFENEIGYATPKVDVRGAAFQNDTVLLVRERSDQKWTLPGGWADMNYSPSYCVCKEFREESGYEVQVKKLIALYDKWKHPHPLQWPHTYKCFFLCEIVGGESKTSIETSEVSFFPVNNLPPLSLPRVTVNQIERCYAHFLDPSLASDID